MSRLPRCDSAGSSQREAVAPNPRCSWQERGLCPGWQYAGTLAVRAPAQGWPAPAPEAPARTFVLFDLDSTLVETRSGRKFAKDAKDWRWKYDVVPSGLRAIAEAGYVVALLTNQLGAAYGSAKDELLRARIDDVLASAGVADRALVLAATADDGYRKPRTGMWRFLLERVGRARKRGSFFVGDAAGRAGDFSDTDRKFALNVCGLFDGEGGETGARLPGELLHFETPEEFFGDEEPLSHALSGWAPTLEAGSLHRDELERATAGEENPDVVVLVGRPASGKSTLCATLFEPMGYVRVCQDELGTLPRCLAQADRLLSEQLSVVVDATNASRAARARWVELARRRKALVKAVVLDVPPAQALHMNRYREATGGKAHVPSVAYRVYDSAYEEPSEQEGFAAVVRLRPELTFQGERERRLFLQRYE